jgi:hypothetical protein
MGSSQSKGPQVAAKRGMHIGYAQSEGVVPHINLAQKFLWYPPGITKTVSQQISKHPLQLPFQVDIFSEAILE